MTDSNNKLENEEAKQYKGDIFHYGRKKSAELKKSSEFVENLRNKVLPIVENVSVSSPLKQKTVLVEKRDYLSDQIAKLNNGNITEFTEPFRDLVSVAATIRKIVNNPVKIELSTRGRWRREFKIETERGSRKIARTYVAEVHTKNRGKRKKTRPLRFILNIKVSD